jgi:ribA/ribD-fused uncharacterized protein
MPEDAITSFRGEYRWLSNFWRVYVVFEGIVFPSVENAYQAAKFVDGRERFVKISEAAAKELGHANPPRPDWETIKVSVMRMLLAQKFESGTELAQKLIATHPKKIIEGNTWNDTFWGVCHGKGKNMLGKLLMERRDILRLST